MMKASRLTQNTRPALDPQAHFIDGPTLPSGTTRFWLVRHGVVEEDARRTMYGTLDVPLCPRALQDHQPAYASLARRLPHDALWFSSPLQRAYQTGLTIQKEGHFSTPIVTDADFTEQSMGQWSGEPHTTFPTLLSKPSHPFWSIAADETPPEGESMDQVKQRIGSCLERLAHTHTGRDMVVLSHGGAIRMALAHALQCSPDMALHLTIQNLSVSIIEHIAGYWRVISVNALPDFGEKTV